MITIRKAEERGTSSLDWLDSKHTFSFSHYYDPKHMGFGHLRVINDDRVAAGGGFAEHPHSNMEIISYVLEGALEHKDSMGNGSVIRPGEVQRMSAGTGVTHSEYNHSSHDSAHFLQIWFVPDNKDTAPGYEQKPFDIEQKRGRFCLVASKTGREQSVSLQQDVDMSIALLNGDEVASYALPAARQAWIHVARGQVNLNGYELFAGDGAGITDTNNLTFAHGDNAEVIVLDMQRQ